MRLHLHPVYLYLDQQDKLDSTTEQKRKRDSANEEKCNFCGADEK